MENNYLQEEIRNDFLVDRNRKKIWAVELDLLEQLQKICDKYGLKCFANGGTLLGVIRHKGFIPWDDDLDVAFSREDFNKLCKVAPNEFCHPYFFQYALTDKNYFVGIARLRNTDTTGIITFLSDHAYNNGIYIDIYVYDKIPEDNKKLKKLISKVKIYEYFLNNYFNYNNQNKKLFFMKPIFKLTKYFITYEKLYNKYLKVCMSYQYKNTNRLGFLCMPYFIKYEETVTGISQLTEMEFEYLKINVPADYDKMLTKAYGDYMKFPPIEERGKWHENIIIFDPDMPFLEYYKINKRKYEKVLKEYGV